MQEDYNDILDRMLEGESSADPTQLPLTESELARIKSAHALLQADAQRDIAAPMILRSNVMQAVHATHTAQLARARTQRWMWTIGIALAAVFVFGTVATFLMDGESINRLTLFARIAETITRFMTVMVINTFRVILTVGSAVVRAPLTWVALAVTFVFGVFVMGAVSNVTRANLDLVRAQS